MKAAITLNVTLIDIDGEEIAEPSKAMISKAKRTIKDLLTREEFGDIDKDGNAMRGSAVKVIIEQ